MDIKLRELSQSDGMDIFEMLKEIPPDENGFINGAHTLSFEQFSDYLKRQTDFSKGINLDGKFVPQTTYWLTVDGKLVGMGKLRHYLNDNLRKSGGHIGYAIRPSERGKGYGNIILKELLNKAKEKGILEVLLTCNEDNILSRKVIEANHGLLESVLDGKCRYWVKMR
ncbi:MAG: GNAT family N-acetyltransferase [Alicyclobacillus sp.]|nr:GNAT family N-acetyltransferase [Alicyclobacillus sp.]